AERTSDAVSRPAVSGRLELHGAADLRQQVNRDLPRETDRMSQFGFRPRTLYKESIVKLPLHSFNVLGGFGVVEAHENELVDQRFCGSRELGFRDMRIRLVQLGRVAALRVWHA